MDYLIYVEYNAENLQFYLWYKDYVRRYEALAENEKALSPEWIPEADEVPDLTKDAEKGDKKRTKRGITTALMETGYDGKNKSQVDLANPGRHMSVNKETESSGSLSVMSDSTIPSDAEVAARAGLKWQPCRSIYPLEKRYTDRHSYHPTDERRDQQSNEALPRLHGTPRT